MVSDNMQHSSVTELSVRSANSGHTIIDAAIASLAQWRRIVPSSRGLMITTDVLYEDGTSVVVVITPAIGEDMVIVHDDGGAEDRLAASGRVSSKGRTAVMRVAKRWGLSVGRGWTVYSGPSPMQDLAALIPIVANASREAAAAVRSASQPRARRDLVRDVLRIAREQFPDRAVASNRTVLGGSHRSYEFDAYFELEDDIAVLVEAITPASRSINSAFVANADIARRTDARFVSFVVYSGADTERFGAAAFSLLASVASVVEIKSLAAELRRVA